MKAYDIKTLKCATLLRGYFLERELPDEIRKAVDHLTGELESILEDVNQIVEADCARQERERIQKREMREAKRETIPPDIQSPLLKRDYILIPKESPGDAEVLPDEEPAADARHPEKTRKPWSPERKAAQAERMRATQDRLRKAKNSPLGEAQAPSQGGA
ncbi:hypothetical protein [Zavarzinella formosa]|uniref:hypothetical protein n=1 Tax=Zavarzinella formosa TaxID=360055 RepID=UPI0002E15E2F|nr:hypothetical protein [Zavarzinella formosa]